MSISTIMLEREGPGDPSIYDLDQVSDVIFVFSIRLGVQVAPKVKESVPTRIP